MTKSKRRRRESPEARATRAQQQQQHWLSYVGLWRFASDGVMDLTAGYPTAAPLVVAGSTVFSKA